MSFPDSDDFKSPMNQIIREKGTQKNHKYCTNLGQSTVQSILQNVRQ